jgi:CRP/FNR family transcriptional regulator, cyclic AMP receptor protein
MVSHRPVECAIFSIQAFRPTLVDQLFNSSEKRLARVLLLMAEFGQPGKEEILNPENNTRSLGRHDWDHQIASEFFHESLRKLGLIEYNGRIRVRKSLLNVILHDQFSG